MQDSLPSLVFLSTFFNRMNFSFSTRVFIFGIPLSYKKRSETALVNFLISIGKLAIYKTRKAKLLANADILCDVVIVFEALVMARLRLEFSFCQMKDDLQTFVKKWCAKGGFYKLIMVC